MSLPINQFHKKLPNIIKNRKVFFDMGIHNVWDETIMNAVRAIHAESKRENEAPDSICDIKDIIYEMRLIKDSQELDIMRRAAEISSNAPQGQCYTLELDCTNTKWKRRFYTNSTNMDAKLQPTPQWLHRAKTAAYHLCQNNDQLKNGELLLIDAGCELESYASDITRTFPIGKQYSPPQKDIYELVSLPKSPR